MSCSWLTKERLEYAIKKWGPVHVEYIKKTERVFRKAVQEYPRLLAVRIDLRFPGDASIPVKTDANTITRMMKSLDEKIKANGKRKQKKGIRVYPCRIRFVWVREFGKKGNRHYHVLLLLNKDAYYHPGDYRKKQTLAYMIKSAWASALGIDFSLAEGLVEFPLHGCYWIKRDGERQVETSNEVMFRASYFAKKATKVYGDGQRNFGCSQG